MPRNGLGSGPPPRVQEIVDALASLPFTSINEAQEWLNEHMHEYNTAPQKDLAGLSPDQLMRLLSEEWSTTSILRLNPALRPEALRKSAWFLGMRALVQAIDTRGGIATDSARAEPGEVEELAHVVSSAVGRSGLAGTEVAAGEMSVHEVLLSELVAIAMIGKLLRRQRGKLVVTKVARTLCGDEAAGALFLHLFTTFFRDVDLCSLYDTPAEFAELQETFPFVLFRLSTETHKWTAAHHLMKRCLHPETREKTRELDRLPAHMRSAPLAVLLLQPLLQLGLLEARLPTPGSLEPQYRQTPLFGDFIQFVLGTGATPDDQGELKLL